MERYEVKKIVRRSAWNRIRNRRGGKQVIWIVVDNVESRVIAEMFTRRAARDHAREVAREATERLASVGRCGHE
jgi:hypothetical protein